MKGRKRTKDLVRGVAGIVLTTAISGCTYMADRYNASGAERDVPGLLKLQGVEISDIKCAMLSGSREFTCEFKLTPEMAGRLRSKFKLRAAKPGDPEFQYHKPAGCEAKPDFRDAKAEKHYIASVRQSERIPELSQFTHMRLHYRPDSSRACLRSTYGYG